MDARPRGDGLLRPSDLPEVIAHRRALLHRSRVPTAELAASTDDLRRIDMMITANEDRAQSPASAMAWTVVVTVVAGLLVLGGFRLITVVTEPRIWDIAGTAGGLLLVLGGFFSGVLCVVYLWAGVALHRRTIRQDRAFRSAMHELLPEVDQRSVVTGSSRAWLVGQLNAVGEEEMR
jgi:UPF0716 family protein affecting phage T7 exclusion